MSALFGGKSAGPEFMDEARREAAFTQYDAICEEHGAEPADLVRLDDQTLTAWAREQVAEQYRHHAIPIGMLRKLVGEYAAACGAEPA